MRLRWSARLLILAGAYLQAQGDTAAAQAVRNAIERIHAAAEQDVKEILLRDYTNLNRLWSARVNNVYDYVIDIKDIKRLSPYLKELLLSQYVDVEGKEHIKTAWCRYLKEETQ